jgi:hypothetical protein
MLRPNADHKPTLGMRITPGSFTQAEVVRPLI